MFHREQTARQRTAADVIALASVAAVLACSVATWYREDAHFFDVVLSTSHHNAWQAPDPVLSRLGLVAAAATGVVGAVLVLGLASPAWRRALRTLQPSLAAFALVALSWKYVQNRDEATLAAYAGLGAVALALVSTVVASVVACRRRGLTA